MKVNKYYFDVAIQFESDYDVSNLEKLLGVKPTLLVQLKDSKGLNKTAKFTYKSKIYDEIDTAGEFENFLKENLERLEKVLPVVKANKGKITLYIVFTQIEDKPVLYLSNETLKLLAKLDVDFEIDYA